MQAKVYELLIFQDEQVIFYYDPLNISEPNYKQLQESHRIQNLVGVSKSINALINQIYPSERTMFRNYKTKQYQFNQYDTVNGLKIIIITSIRSDQKAEEILKSLYQAYLNHVKRNYMFQVGDIIDLKPFKDEAVKLLKELTSTN